MSEINRRTNLESELDIVYYPTNAELSLLEAVNAANIIYKLQQHRSGFLTSNLERDKFQAFNEELMQSCRKLLNPETIFWPPAHFIGWYYLTRYGKEGDASLVKMALAVENYIKSDFLPWGRFKLYEGGVSAWTERLTELEARWEKLESAEQLMDAIYDSDLMQLYLSGEIKQIDHLLYKTRLRNIERDVECFAAEEGAKGTDVLIVLQAKKMLMLLVHESCLEVSGSKEDYSCIVEVAKTMKVKNGININVLIAGLESFGGQMAMRYLEALSKNAISKTARTHAIKSLQRLDSARMGAYSTLIAALKNRKHDWSKTLVYEPPAQKPSVPPMLRKNIN
ncbi:hypothetical protein FJZ26_02120 [Candidatus Parvarchaeota archaeon]|nr:hypothetical protein [Candidatus Parvarchaeota archaeon]